MMASESKASVGNDGVTHGREVGAGEVRRAHWPGLQCKLRSGSYLEAHLSFTAGALFVTLPQHRSEPYIGWVLPKSPSRSRQGRLLLPGGFWEALGSCSKSPLAHFQVKTI